ncbi:MAG: DUF192 domain-containing protein [Leptospirales bacterium]|nr:DUF192 domain-containing protein [Leptospirales bacterium]
MRSLAAAGLLFAVLTCDHGPAGAQSPLAEHRNPVEVIQVGARNVEAEIVSTYPARERGLMDRGYLGGDRGMLFIFKEEQPLAFWMKNTLIPLDIGFFGSDGVLLNIVTMQPDPPGTPDEDRRTYLSAAPAMYALEVNAGWFAERGVRRGARLTLPPSIRDLRGE